MTALVNPTWSIDYLSQSQYHHHTIAMKAIIMVCNHNPCPHDPNIGPDVIENIAPAVGIFREIIPI